MQAVGSQQNAPAQPFQRPDLSNRRDGNQPSAPSPAQPADASPSFADRFSAIYGSSSARPVNGFGQSIPFASRPAGALGTPGDSVFLNPAPMNPGVVAPFAAGTQFIPGSASSSRSLYPTGSFALPPGAPNAPTPQNNRRSDIPDGSMPTLAQAASPDANASVSFFTRLLSAGPDAALAADDTASPPLQPDATDNSPTRFLVRRTYDPSQGSPFTARPAPSQPSPDGSLSIDDAYLEYLKRLNAA